MGKVSHRELNAQKYKKFVGNKREGTNFLVVSLLHLAYTGFLAVACNHLLLKTKAFA